MTFRFPGPGDRTFVCGKTGSGKTRFGVWLFAQNDFNARPHIIIDFKRDDLIKRISRAKRIGFSDGVPKHPGLYVLQCMPEDGRLEKFLWDVWKQTNIGLYIDEAFSVPRMSRAYKTILTQGRSLRVSCLSLTQRPVFCAPFVVSEADYIAIFRLMKLDDYKTVQEFVPYNETFDFERRLPDFTCRWYDDKREYSAVIKPVPDDAALLTMYDDALRLKTRGI